MWCTSGCAPVAIDARQTGVSDGKVEAARRYSPCSARKRSAGASAPRTSTASDRRSRPGRRVSAPALSPARACAGPRACRASGGAAALRERHGDRLEVADDGDERERGADERDERRAGSTCRRACRRAAARRATSGAEPSAPQTAPARPPTRFVPLAEHEADRDRSRGGGDEPDERRAGATAVAATPSAAPSPTRIPIVYQVPTTRVYVAGLRAARPSPASSRAITARANGAARAPSTTRWSKVTLTFPIGAHDDLAVAHDRRAARCGGRRGCRPPGG